MLQDAVKDLDFESVSVDTSTDIRGRYRLDLYAFPDCRKGCLGGDAGRQTREGTRCGIVIG
jgi:hypothetical protein